MSLPRDRRRFLKELTGGFAGIAATPAILAARPLLPEQGVEESPPRSLPRPGVGAPDEAFWREVKNQFSLREGLVLLNAANLCPAPYPVQGRLLHLSRDVDADASFQNRAKFGELREDARHAVARLVGADPDEIALVRNTSEANNTVVQGVDLGPGDEVVLWDQNHPTNLTAWEVRAERSGFEVRTVSTPGPGSDVDAILGPFLDAMGPRTRVLAFSHVSNVSGEAIPAGALCSAARERGVWTLVDGAQTFGSLELDLHAMGCDFFSASAHKWLMGPREVGMLYVRKERIPDLWAADVGVGWESALEGGARKFETLGQRDDAAVAAVETAVAFHEELGTDVVEDRVRALATAAIEGLRERVPEVRFSTPWEPALRAGVVVFDLPGIEGEEAYRRLYEEHGIAGAPRGGAYPGVRFSPHIYNTLADLERAVDAAASLV